MKNLTFGIALILITFLASCKKDYNCSCDYYVDGEYQVTNDTKINGTKYKAKKECKEMNSDLTFGFGGSSYHAETKCSLK